MRAIGWLWREGCSMISTTTTWPAFAGNESSGATRMSWLTRRSSATTKRTPCSTSSRPTTRWLARSSTSTTTASRLPRRGAATSRPSTRSPCSTFCISAGPRNRSPVASSGTRKPKPSGCPCTRPRIRSIFDGSPRAPRRLTITSPSRSIAARRREKPSADAGATSSISDSRSGSIGTPASRRASRTFSRSGTMVVKTGLFDVRSPERRRY